MIFHILRLLRLSWWPLFRSRGHLRLTRAFSLHMENGARIIGPGTLTCGATKNINRHSMNAGMVTVKRGGVLFLKGDAYIGEGTSIVVHSQATLTIGHGSYITGDSRIEVKKYISIGDNCAISWNVTILDDDHHQHSHQNKKPSSTVIGDNVWIGAHAMILKGANIGNGSIVAAKALVNAQLPSGTLCGGIPAKILKESVKWQK